MGYDVCFVNATTTICFTNVRFRFVRRTQDLKALDIPTLDAVDKPIIAGRGTEEMINISTYRKGLNVLETVINDIRTLVPSGMRPVWTLELRYNGTTVWSTTGVVTDASIDVDGGSERIDITIGFKVGK